jgi:hypothetical protein
MHGNEITPERPEMAYGCSVTMRYSDDPEGDIGLDIGRRVTFHEMDNVYYIEFDPTRAGDLLLTVKILGVEIPASPVLVRPDYPAQELPYFPESTIMLL